MTKINNHNNLILNSNGYRLLYFPDHPKSMKGDTWDGYVYEHIIIAETFLGRSLRENEVVHHLNGDKSNNRTENLLVLERSQHAKLHIWMNSGFPFNNYQKNTESENLIKASYEPASFCIVCNRTLQLKQEKYCSQECFKIDSRKVERPSKKTLTEDIQSMSILKVGKKYGVSDNAIRKWMKSYGIKKIFTNSN